MAETCVAIAAAAIPPLGGFACLFGLQSWSDKNEAGSVKPFENPFKSMSNAKAMESMKKVFGDVETKLKMFKK